MGTSDLANDPPHITQHKGPDIHGGGGYDVELSGGEGCGGHGLRAGQQQAEAGLHVPPGVPVL